MQFLVAVDGSAESDRTLDYVLDLADAMANSVAITVVHSVDPGVYTTGGIEPVADLADADRRLLIENITDVEDRGREILEEAASHAADRGIDVDTELRYGDPVDEVSNFASDAAVDGVFVGHRGRSERAERFLGSVAKGLVERVDRPVMVVR